MTLATRNKIFLLSVCISVTPLVLAVVYLTRIWPVLAGTLDAAARRSTGFMQFLSVSLLPASSLVPLLGILAAVVYALICLLLMYIFFEKTQSSEILFFTLFILTFSAEGLRLITPLSLRWDLPHAYAVTACRGLLFGRHFGLFSLFLAGVYAAGFEFQKQGNLILILIVTSLMIATGVPVDGLSWDSAFTTIPGYNSMFVLVEIGIALITAASFIVAAYTRGSPEFTHTALGSFLLFLGRDGLLRADNWIALPVALLFLTAGTWLIATRLHRYYLWL